MPEDINRKLEEVLRNLENIKRRVKRVRDTLVKKSREM